jgi:hypothetical protein
VRPSTTWGCRYLTIARSIDSVLSAAIPFDSPIRSKLGGAYKVSGIPAFIILDKDGKVVSSKGREKVIADPSASSFPWNAQGNVWSLLEKADKFVNKHGKSVDVKYLKGLDAFGMYFSAHWCPPYVQPAAHVFLTVLADRADIVQMPRFHT